MARSLTSTLYRAARLSSNIRAVSRGPAVQAFSRLTPAP